MKKIQLTFYLLTILMGLLWLAPDIQAQGAGGCPSKPTPNSAVQYQVIDVIALAPAFPETMSGKMPGAFFEGNINLIYQPHQRVILSSTPDGDGALCSDDLVKIQSATWLMFEHDFRSADRSRIVPLEPLDVTGLFNEEGDYSLQISLIDLTPQQFSSSPYYLVVVESDPGISFPPPAAILTPTPSRTTPTFTPTPRPTTTSTPTPTPTHTPTLTPTSTLSITVAMSDPPTAKEGIGLPTVPPRIYIALSLLAVATILAVIIVHLPRLTNLLEITKDGQPYKTVDLSTHGRQTTIGAKGRIKLEDDEDNPDIPSIAARLIAERGPDGNVQVIWQSVEDEADVEAASYRLQHGDREIIGPYQVVYQNFSETETVNELFEGGIWNEV